MVVGDGAMRPKGGSQATVALVDLDHLRDGPHRHLGRKTEAVPDFVVAELLQLDLVRTAMGVRDFGDCIASSIAPLHGRQKRSGLLWQRQELGLQGQVHGCV